VAKNTVSYDFQFIYLLDGKKITKDEAIQQVVKISQHKSGNMQKVSVG
jgi:hypothetical protein